MVVMVDTGVTGVVQVEASAHHMRGLDRAFKTMSHTARGSFISFGAIPSSTFSIAVSGARAVHHQV